MPDFVLDPEFYDVAWDRLPEPEAHGGLQFSQVQNRNEWIVKLQFEQDGETHYGTGFYVNIPHQASRNRDVHVILTAGHNLVDSRGKMSQNLQILQPAGRGPPISQGQGLQLFVSESYRSNPSQANAANDYGAILVPRGSIAGSPRAFGFGFALKLGHDNLRGDDLDVSGYRVDSTPGQPETSAGKEEDDNDVAVDEFTLI